MFQPSFRRQALACVALLVAVACTQNAIATGKFADHRASPPTFVVTSADDWVSDGCTRSHCNLREAIHAANRRGGQIRFVLPDVPRRIELQAALPALRNRVHIDGSEADDGCPLPGVLLDGSALKAAPAAGDARHVRHNRHTETGAPDGLVLAGDGNSVRGLVISGFPGNGVLVRGNHNTLQCLFVGTGPDGLEPAGNGGHGIAVAGGSGNQVGGPEPEHGNLLAANGGLGLYIEDAIGTHFANNGIGVDLLGNPKLPNADELGVPLNDPPRARIRHERLLKLVQARVERRIAAITALAETPLADAGLFERYARLIDEQQGGALPPPTTAAGLPGEPVPLSPTEVLASLPRYPELYSAFTTEAAQELQRVQGRQLTALVHLQRIYRRIVPALGHDAPIPAEDNRDTLGELLATFNPDDYVVSGGPVEIVAVTIGPDLVEISPITFHSLETYGPLNFVATLASIPVIRTCNTPGTCFWPIGYDFLPGHIQLLWQSSSLSAGTLQNIVTQSGYQLQLFVNGIPLQIGPSFDGPLQQGYYAATVSAAPCPSGRNCLATSVLARNVLRNVPKPWTFTLKVFQIADLPNPVIDGIDEFGNFIFKTKSRELIAQSSRTVVANPDSGHLNWFTEALYPTFQHPRCTDCHGFENFDGLAAHHGYTNTANFVSATNLHLEPSLYVPGAQVMACTSCHILALSDPGGQPFHEVAWVAPYFDLDVNWAQKTSAQTCSRVKSNLPTKDLRHLHFHGDSRLFFAVQYPHVPGGVLPAAPPEDWSEFLRRVDLWNIFGAPCP